MSLFTLNIIIYVAGAIAKQIEVYAHRDYYIEFTKNYIREKLKMKPNKVLVSFFLASLAVTWPLDIILEIYFRFFYKGD